MRTVVLKFNTLSAAAAFLKTVKPSGYTLNTVTHTLACSLTDFELALALETESAAVVTQDASLETQSVS